MLKCNYCGAIHDGNHSCPEVKNAFKFMTINQCPKCESSEIIFNKEREVWFCHDCKAEWPPNWKEVKK